MDKPAEALCSLYATNPVELVVAQVGDRYLEVEPAVRALMVVVGHEVPHDAVEVALAPDHHPIEALGPCCAHKSLRERVRPRRPNGCLDDPGTGRAQYFVKWPDELCIAVTDQGP